MLRVVTACLLATAALAADPLLTERPMVWAHSMLCFPLDLRVYRPWVPELYPALYPLQAGWDLKPAWQDTDLRAARDAGIDGFAVDVFVDGHAARGHLAAADRVGGFKIAPCLDLSTVHDVAAKEAAAVKTITDYCADAAEHPSSARVGDAFLIFTYGTEQLPPEAWQRVRDQLAAAGCKTWWMVSVDTDGKLVHADTLPAEAIERYFPPFEAGYLFGSAWQMWAPVVDLFRRHGRPFGGGMMPGYYRVGGGHQDALGTATYRREWDQHLRTKGQRWACLSTWNDLAENTELMPSSDWSTTRAELTRWYAARFRGEPAPWAKARLYVTTPKAVYPGSPAPAEALVLNGGARPVRVELELLDAAGRPTGEPVAAEVPAGELGAVQAGVAFSGYPQGRFLRARARLLDGERVVTSVVSAPILLLDPEAQPGLKTTYYSLPADRALPAQPSLALTGEPVGGGTATAVTGPGVAAPRTVDLLHNGALAQRWLTEANDAGPGPYTATVPVVRKGEVAGGTEWGFYLSRVVDAEGHVGYSDPVYVAPKGDLRVREDYAFDEGQGKQATDGSPYRRVAELVDVTWVTPGHGGAGALSFNGRSSRVNLPLYQTPDGPMKLSLAVRPRRWGGMLFADGGGTWLTTNADGRPSATRLGPAGWVTVTGPEPLKLGEWAVWTMTWDGATLHLAIDGREVGSVPCPPKFASWRRALGCNPYDGSAFFDGDLDAFRIETLPGR